MSVSKEKSVGGTQAKVRTPAGPPTVAKAGIVAAGGGPVRADAAEEQRLEDKAAVADTQRFAGPSLGQMSREERRKFLFESIEPYGEVRKNRELSDGVE